MVPPLVKAKSLSSQREGKSYFCICRLLIPMMCSGEQMVLVCIQLRIEMGFKKEMITSIIPCVNQFVPWQEKDCPELDGAAKLQLAWRAYRQSVPFEGPQFRGRFSRRASKSLAWQWCGNVLAELGHPRLTLLYPPATVLQRTKKESKYPPLFNESRSLEACALHRCCANTVFWECINLS